MNDITEESFREEEDISGSENNQKRGFYYKISILTFLLTLALFYFDFGPPLPPYTPSFKTDDCFSLKLQSFNNNQGILNFSFYADETYELPREYLPNLIKIRGVSDIANVTYFGARYSNRTQNGSFVNIVIPHHFIASFDFMITCLNDMKLAEFQENITEINNENLDSSKSTQIGPKEELFENVCLEKKTSLIDSFISNYNNNDLNQNYVLKFFSYVNEKHIPFDFSPNTQKDDKKIFRLDFECEPNKYHEFLNARNLKSEKHDCILSPPIDENLWQLILFDLPEIENVRVWSQFDDFYLIVPNVTSTASIIKTKIYDFQSFQCFDSLTIANFHSNASLASKEDNEYIWGVLNQNFTNFRERFAESYDHNSGQIISISDDSNLTNLKEAIEKVCIESSADCSVLTFEHNSFKNKLSNLMGKTKVLIGNHITNLAPLALMKKGTHVIDFSSQKYSCNEWTKKFAEKFDINYHSFFENDINSGNKCICANFSSCYPEYPENVHIDNIDKLKNLLINILMK